MGCVMGIGERYKDNPAQQFPAQMLYSYRTMWAVLEKIPACPDIQYIGVQRMQQALHSGQDRCHGLDKIPGMLITYRRMLFWSTEDRGTVLPPPTPSLEVSSINSCHMRAPNDLQMNEMHTVIRKAL